MSVEIERRFIVAGDTWRGLAPGVKYRQGYLSANKSSSVRVRVVGSQAWLTLKSNINNVRRHEFEYPVPIADAQTIMTTMCQMVVEKLRHRIEYAGFVWEVDEFYGNNAGLVLAEIELTEENSCFDKPSWIGQEVTEDSRYTNAYLSQTPYDRW